MNVLSLFDGISCGQIALNRVGIKYENYYASEIDKFAIKCTQHNYPNTIQLGDISNWKSWDIDWSKIGLVAGGFPCQAWSIAGKQLGDKDERGKLFWVMLDIMKHVLKHNPEAKFLIENVKMKKEFEQYITYHTEKALGKAEKHLINSALVSAQNRNRYYWTNIPLKNELEDKKITWKDVMEHDTQNVYYVTPKMMAWVNKSDERVKKFKVYTNNTSDKMQMLEASHHKGISNQRCFAIQDIHGLRYVSVLECERLQTVPDNYTSILSNTQRYKCLGNGWTVDVIAHIFKGLKQ